MKFEKTKILAVRPEGDGAVAITLDADFDWTPGQYLTLRARIDGEEVRRSYSIAACPGQHLTVVCARCRGVSSRPGRRR